ncbi:MAG: T9SS type A sorting domain-containing protein [Flavobacteriales bacterium]|nr:T9SS type A sorting domain-containing protein [Flavobacteriales bacterium]
MMKLLKPLSLAFGAMAALTTSAQQPNSILLSGTVFPCDPNTVVTVQTVQGTLPQFTATIPVGPNCSYSIMVDVATNPSWLQVSTACNGAMINNSGSAVFNGIGDTAVMVLDLNCGGFVVDCNGVVNGPDMPGTPCDDGNPFTVGDTWDANCNCAGMQPPACNADFTVQNPAPWQITTTNLSTGNPPLTYQWWMPDGTPSTQAEPAFTFSQSGVYGICLTVTDADSCSSWMCDTLAVDSSGMISNTPIWYDCLGVLWGPATPGTPCDDGDPNTFGDAWTPNCACVGMGQVDCLGIPGGPNVPGTSCWIPGTNIQGTWTNNCVCDSNMVVDCLGIPGGTALPGTVCIDSTALGIFTGFWDMNCVCQPDSLIDCLGNPGGTALPGTPCDDGDSLTVQDTWTANCTCIGVPINYFDCLGVMNGTALPGTPCDDGDPMTTNDTWNANCDCVGGFFVPCEADFWVLQAYDTDSLNGIPTPIPNLLWVWNLSSGGSGTYSYLWDFGDSTTSTDAFPTHYYANGGPYLLCLTIDDGQGCVNTYCDTISIDANGMYTGMVMQGGNRDSGFTINVLNPLSTSIHEQFMLEGLATWPNPVNDVLNVVFESSMQGAARIEVLDLNGRLVLTQRTNLNSGRNLERIDTEGLVAGMYLLRITNDRESISQRFVRGR